MKKFFAAFLAVTAILSACACFAGCDRSDEVKASRVTLEASEITLEMGQTQEFKYTAVPENATLEIHIGNSSVLDYSYSEGAISARFPGKTSVEVRSPDGNVSALCDVTVTAPEGYAAHFSDVFTILYPKGWTKIKGTRDDVEFENEATGSSISVALNTYTAHFWTSAKTYESWAEHEISKQGYSVKSLELKEQVEYVCGVKYYVYTVECEAVKSGGPSHISETHIWMECGSETYVYKLSVTDGADEDIYKFLTTGLRGINANGADGMIYFIN